MTNIENNHIGPAASQLLAIEVISELLVSTSPQKLCEALSDHLRELTGARTVIILSHRPEPAHDELLHVSPERRKELFTPEELNLFCFEKPPDKLPNTPEELPEQHPLKAKLLQSGIHSMVRYALQAGGELVGLLLLFDLPGVSRISETNQIVTLLAPPIALALKNALAYFQIEQLAQELEQRVEERTAELQEKNAELRKSEEHHRVILQTAMDGIWLLDTQGRFIEVNEAYCKMSGYSMHELLTMSVTDVEAEETRADTAAHMQKVIELGEDRFSSRHRRKDGTLFDIEISVKYQPFEGGQLIAFLHDITERKLAEAALAESEYFFRASQSAALIGSYKADFLAGRWESTEVLNTIFGIDSNYDRSIQGWLNIVHPDDRDLMDRYLMEEVISNRKTFSYEYRIIRQNDGEVRWVNGRGIGEFDNENNLILLMGTIQDITERKKAEEEKAQLESRLQQAQKMESIGRLAGGVAHDFNNMLTVIMGHAQLGLMHMDPDHPICADLQEISKSAERSADLTRQLLAFARKQTVAPKVLNLNETVTEMLKMLQRLIGEDIKLDWQPALEIWQIRMDPSQIDQILANLCVNARDAIAGTGRITIETANRTIDKEYCSVNLEAMSGEYVCLSVSDSGSGMDKETLTHIFEPFYTTKELGKGTGLGLATVYGAVKQNNGFINIYSEMGQGTTFSIYLPRDISSSKRLALSESDKAPVPRGQETILLVEDEPAILNITSIMLERQGYTVLKADTPGEAIRLAREHSAEIQLLMTDVIMPEMNGRDLAKNLLTLYPHMKRLFMSGYTADVIATHGVLEEGVHFIQKPFALPTMAAMVREVLDSK